MGYIGKKKCMSAAVERWSLCQAAELTLTQAAILSTSCIYRLRQQSFKKKILLFSIIYIIIIFKQI